MVKNWPKQHDKLFFLPEQQKKASDKGRSPPQELKVGTRSIRIPKKLYKQRLAKAVELKSLHNLFRVYTASLEMALLISCLKGLVLSLYDNLLLLHFPPTFFL